MFLFCPMFKTYICLLDFLPQCSLPSPLSLTLHLNSEWTDRVSKQIWCMGVAFGDYVSTAATTDESITQSGSLWTSGICLDTCRHACFHVVHLQCCCASLFRLWVLSKVPWPPCRSQILSTTSLCPVAPTSQGQVLLGDLVQSSQANLRTRTHSVCVGGVSWIQPKIWPSPTYITWGANYICELAFDSPLFFS